MEPSRVDVPHYRALGGRSREPRLAQRVAIVTGAGAGIGRATAMLFAAEGARVICVDARDAGDDRVDRRILSEGGDARFIAADVTTSEGSAAMVALALQEFGRLDVLVNNVGDGVRGRLHETDDREWRRIIDVNLTSVFLGVKKAVPVMLKQGGGVIINTASSFGLLATARYPGYCASKAAVVNLTRQLAIDYGPQIRVNCVCPGATASPRLLKRIAASTDPEAEHSAIAARNSCLNRLAHPAEIAYAFLFLASDESSFVTGHALAVDGGQTVDA